MAQRIDFKTPPASIAIAMDFAGGPQPNHFGAAMAHAEPMQAGGFIGDTTQGGSCNAPSVTFNPHCNGTHTESISHVIDELVPPHEVVKQPLMLAHLLTLEPVSHVSMDTYSPPLEPGDKVICRYQLTPVKKNLHAGVKALIIRTLPNTQAKLSHRYGQDIQPAFFSHEAMHWLVNETAIEHLLVDLPSVDRLHDDGVLNNHRLFWNIEPGSHATTAEQFKHKTITEMVYVPNEIKDGAYLLNLQLPRLNLNAVPSNPLLYRLDTNQR
ncbi:cyclase family protein [Marinicella meishanensis]|uniref:cyclase family protein n=1 Tax=Marinicella meishanensis TaxID=2873263 RepID=UPI001CBEFED3|nr:cyclase family protein [Marinicella sp. NBU2979]